MIAFFLAVLGLVFFGGCRKRNSSTHRLPPQTHSGLNTMGCTVDGKLFIPQAPALDPYPLYTVSLDGYPGPRLFMAWSEKINACPIYGISIALDSVILQQNRTYDLGEHLDTGSLQGIHTQWATYAQSGCNGSYYYTTTRQVTGQTTITWYDPAGGIVAGTFWFDAVDEAGDTIHVRDGRFDMSTK